MLKKKNKQLIRIVIVLISLLISIMIYWNSFDVDALNIEKKLNVYLDVKDVHVIELQPLEENAKNTIVYYETETSSGIALLNKGLNNNYQICNTHQINGGIASVAFLVNRKDYVIFYGQEEEIVSTINIYPEVINNPLEINSKRIFFILNSRVSEGMVEINYATTNNADKKQSVFISDQGSSWKNFTTPLKSILVVILSFFITYPLSKRFNTYELQALNNLPKDGQRIKLFTPWGTL